MSAVSTFKFVQGEWLFQEMLNHLGMTEDEFKQKYESKLDKDPNALNEVIIEMMRKNILKGVVKKCSE